MGFRTWLVPSRWEVTTDYMNQHLTENMLILYDLIFARRGSVEASLADVSIEGGTDEWQVLTSVSIGEINSDLYFDWTADLAAEGGTINVDIGWRYFGDDTVNMLFDDVQADQKVSFKRLLHAQDDDTEIIEIVAKNTATEARSPTEQFCAAWSVAYKWNWVETEEVTVRQPYTETIREPYTTTVREPYTVTVREPYTERVKRTRTVTDRVPYQTTERQPYNVRVPYQVKSGRNLWRARATGTYARFGCHTQTHSSTYESSRSSSDARSNAIRRLPRSVTFNCGILGAMTGGRTGLSVTVSQVEHERTETRYRNETRYRTVTVTKYRNVERQEEYYETVTRYREKRETRYRTREVTRYRERRVTRYHEVGSVKRTDRTTGWTVARSGTEYAANGSLAEMQANMQAQAVDIGTTGRPNVTATIEYRRTVQPAIDTSSVQVTPAGTASFTNALLFQRLLVGATENIDTIGQLPIPGVDTVPGVPRNLTATSQSRAIYVSWGLPRNDGGSPITGFLLQWKRSSDVLWTDVSLLAGDTEYTLSGLNERVNYDFQVRAINAIGNGEFSSIVIGAPTIPAVPDAPRGLTVHARDNALEITWNEARTTGGPITGYEVQYRPMGATLWSSVSRTASQFSVSVTQGIVADTVYQVRVRASNGLGDGAWSVIVLSRSATVPTVPLNLALTANTGGEEISATWDAPSSTGGSAVTEYQLRYRETTDDDDGSWTNETGLTATLTNQDDQFAFWNWSTRTYLIDGLDPETEYDVQVRAVNALGNGPWTATVKATTLEETPTAPGIGSLSLLSRDEKSDRTDIRVTITPPSSWGTTTILRAAYYRYRVKGTTQWVVVPNSGRGFRIGSSFFLGLEKDTEYEFQIRFEGLDERVDRYLVGEWSSTVTIDSTIPQVATAPGLPAISSIAVTTNSATLTVTAPSDWGNAHANTRTYDVRFKLSSASQWSQETGSDLIITGLTSGSEYDFQLRATTANGSSNWTATSKATIATPVAPSAPTISSITVTATSATILTTFSAWGNGANRSFDVRYRQTTATNDGAWTTVDSSNRTITGLTTDTEYDFQLRASTSVGDSAWSATTKATPAVASRVSIQVTNSSANNLTVTVTATDSNFYAIWLYYRIIRASDSSASNLRRIFSSTVLPRTATVRPATDRHVRALAGDKVEFYWFIANTRSDEPERTDSDILTWTKVDGPTLT